MIGDYSNLAMTSAVVLYLLAFLAHAVEWASSRSAPETVAGARHVRRQRAGRQRELQTVGLAGAGDGGTGVAEPGPEGLVRDAPATPGAGHLVGPSSPRTELFGRLGLVLTVMGFAVAVAGVVLRGVAAGRAPWGNMYEFIITAMVFIVGAYVVLAKVWAMRWLGLLVTLVATIGNGLAVTVFYVAPADLVPALKTVWFLIHIMAAMLGGAAFTIGGLASILYLIRSRYDRRRAAGEGCGSYLNRLPSPRTLDVVAYRFHAFAFPVWTFAVAAGSVWAEYAWGRYWGWDPKETWALITWVIYACYLHARSTAGWRGTAAAWIAVVGLVSFWFNFIGVNLLLTGLHSYAGI